MKTGLAEKQSDATHDLKNSIKVASGIFLFMLGGLILGTVLEQEASFAADKLVIATMGIGMIAVGFTLFFESKW